MASGGSSSDNFNGAGGADVLTGNGGDDILIGGSGDNRLDGGDGADTLRAGSGKTLMIGGAEADAIEVFSGDGKLADIIRYNAVTDGGVTGDFLTGDLDFILDGDLRFQMTRSAFNTLRNNFDKISLDDGSVGTPRGNQSDGADLVIFNDGSAGLNSISAVDDYFVARYYALDDVGAFLINFDNTTNTTTIYYDSDAFSAGGVTVLAQTTQMSAETAKALANDFSFL